MSRFFALSALPLALALIGCGKVDPDTPVVDMTTEDWTNFFDSRATDEVVETDCGSGVTVTSGESTIDECIAEGEATSSALQGVCDDLLIGDVEQCLDELDADPCNGFASEACATYVGCLFG